MSDERKSEYDRLYGPHRPTQWRDFPKPAWWRFARQHLWRWPRLIGLSSRLYAWRFGFGAPGYVEFMEAQTLHGLNPAVYPQWAPSEPPSSPTPPR